MAKSPDRAARHIGNDRSLDELRAAAAECTACPLHAKATHTVFGEGPAPARLMLVGEQPGDTEDRTGRPFVGPAGKLLDRALADAGIDRGDVYLTNVVKHFRWAARGKRRLHKKPKLTHIEACRPWLDAEIEHVAPTALVALGATAARALFGDEVGVTQARGRPVATDLAPRGLVTVHPAAIVRIRNRDDRAAAYDRFVADLAAAARASGRG